ncbi:MAG: fused MFS/spermidine synthase [Anaerolineales bacterium]|nr:fused MFS/spermidine synthase [Anaerolineales bacterium]
MNPSSRFLSLAVFVSGMTALAVELAASRLLGNVFGTSNLVWANIIGLILVYLTAGYFLGGRWADRNPNPVIFYRIMAWAALTTGAVPVVSRPVLLAAAAAVEKLDAAVVLGSFAAVLVLFSVPVTLMGCISPFAIRLAIRDVSRAGNISGRLYAISTLGSIVGTFLPVLWLIPSIGTARTFFVFAALLLLVALAGLWRTDRRAAVRGLWMPLVLLLLYAVGTGHPIKNTPGQIFERESAYNYIQVVERDGVRYLHLNEGEGMHSVYAPALLLTGGTWDYFLAAPFFNDPPRDPAQVASLAIVGLAAGTSANQYTQVYGPIPIEGYEIDPAILEVGREFFGMTQPNLTALAVDGRWGLAHSRRIFSVIAIDAYRPPYIPPHLTTREFFETVRARLASDGVVTINVARLPDDRRLIEGLAATLQAVFPSVYVADVPFSMNSILFATVRPTGVQNLLDNYKALAAAGGIRSELLTVLEWTIQNLQPTPEGGRVFTDDWAPIELLTNAMVVQFVLSGRLPQLAPQ